VKRAAESTVVGLGITGNASTGNEMQRPFAIRKILSASAYVAGRVRFGQPDACEGGIRTLSDAVYEISI